MNCPKCKNSNTEIVDSRKSGNSHRRRRVCLDCGIRFTTYEIETEEYENFKAVKCFAKNLIELAK